MADLDKDKKNPKKPISMNVAPGDLKGNYANAVRVICLKSEVIIDFAFVVPEAGIPQGEFVTRLIISPSVAKQLSERISNLKLDETKKDNDKDK